MKIMTEAPGLFIAPFKRAAASARSPLVVFARAFLSQQLASPLKDYPNGEQMRKLRQEASFDLQFVLLAMQR